MGLIPVKEKLVGKTRVHFIGGDKGGVGRRVTEYLNQTSYLDDTTLSLEQSAQDRHNTSPTVGRRGHRLPVNHSTTANTKSKLNLF